LALSDAWAQRASSLAIIEGTVFVGSDDGTCTQSKRGPGACVGARVRARPCRPYSPRANACSQHLWTISSTAFRRSAGRRFGSGNCPGGSRRARSFWTTTYSSPRSRATSVGLKSARREGRLTASTWARTTTARQTLCSRATFCSSRQGRASWPSRTRRRTLPHRGVRVKERTRESASLFRGAARAEQGRDAEEQAVQHVHGGRARGERSARRARRACRRPR
jgi:hypothetical protein